MDISIIVVSFNTKELLIDCLNSVEKATDNLEVEIFVVDNNSTDKTAQAIPKLFPKVKFIANSQNLGFAKANNQAIKKAKGRYVLILNPDTKLSDSTLVKMKQFMGKNPKVAIATCRVELPQGNLDRDCRRHFPTPWRAFCHFSGLSKIFSGSKIFDQYHMGYMDESLEHEIDACAGAFMIVRRSLIEKVGFLDEDFFFYGEDLDWCWRFKEAGYKIVYTPVTKIIHYKGVSSGIKPASVHLSKATKESKKKALLESTRAMRLFYQKHLIDKYPFFVNWLTVFAIKVLEKIRQIQS